MEQNEVDIKIQKLEAEKAALLEIINNAGVVLKGDK